MANPEVRTLDDLAALKGDSAAEPQSASTSGSSTPRAAPMPTGRRKDAVARVWVKRGAGKITVNGRDLVVYFARPVLQMILQQPIVAAKREGQFDVVCTVVGGGLSGQAGAVRHGIAAGADHLRAGAARRPQEGWLPHPRRPRGRAQEVRQGQGPTELPVLQALDALAASRFRRAAPATAHPLLSQPRIQLSPR